MNKATQAIFASRLKRMRSSTILAMISAMLTCVGTAQSPFTVPKIQFSGWSQQNSVSGQLEYLASFPSPYISGTKVNDLVQLRVILPEEADEPPPMVLILHYWGASNLRIERALALDLNRRGIGAAILSLPYHLNRAPAGTTSGQLAIQPDPKKLEATMTQAVMDVRRALDFLEQRKECGSLLGIYGTSLGAIVSSLSYANDARLKSAVFLLGGIDLAKLLWESSRVVPIKDELKRLGFTESSLREELRSVEPSQYLPRQVMGRTLVIRATFDSVVPPECTDELINKLPGSQVLEIDTGHYGGVFVQGRLLRVAADFFEAVRDQRDFVLPKKLIAPTIRLGALASSPNGFDVVAGIDILKFDPSGKSYASILLTPRSPVVWFGTTISPGLNLGVSVANRRAGFGLLWSTVL
jgi:dienelactone hydrolase